MNSSNQTLSIFISFPSLVLTDHQANGDGLLAYEYINKLASRGHILHVICQTVKIQATLPENIKIYSVAEGEQSNLPISRFRYFWKSRQLFKQLSQSHKFDIIHELNPGFSFLSLAFTGLNVPVMIGPFSYRWPLDCDDLELSETSIWVRLTRYLGSIFKDSILYLQQLQSSALLFSTPAAGETLGIFGYDESKARVLSIGIDDSYFSPNIKFQDISATNPTILFLARLEIQKGIFTLLDAFNMLIEQVPDCKLIVAGTGQQAETVKTYIQSFKCKDQISIIGNVERSNIVEVINNCNVYCLPSYGEPFGISILEAMACGKPVVTTNLGGPNYIVHDEGGRKVTPRDPKALATALAEILNSQELQTSMGQYNRQLIQDCYTWDRVIDQLENIYYEVRKDIKSSVVFQKTTAS
jgi:L-malate glycosyltransferase